MFYRLLIFSAIALFVYWVVTSYIAPALFPVSDKPKELTKAEEQEKEKSVLQQYTENEISYRNAKEELSQLSAEQAREAERKLAEALAVKEQIEQSQSNN